MKQAKHTPGPWGAVKYPDVKSWTVAARESVASKIKTEADARLIAAAPEMLEALDRFRKYIRVRTMETANPQEYANLQVLCDLADEAITKAAGGDE